MSKQKVWMYRPPRQPKTKAPDGLKAAVKTKADELVKAVIKPKRIKPPPKDERHNYLVDIYTKWYQSPKNEVNNEI